MATPVATALVDPGANGTSTNPDQPLSLDEAESGTTGAVASSGNPHGSKTLDPEEIVIKTDPDDLMGVKSDMSGPYNPPRMCETTTVLQSPSLPQNGDVVFTLSAFNPSMPNDPATPWPSELPSPPQQSPPSLPIPPSLSPSKQLEQQQWTRGEKKEIQLPPKEREGQKPPSEKKEQQLTLPDDEEKQKQANTGEEKEKQTPPEEANKQPLPPGVGNEERDSTAEKKGQQAPVESKEQQPLLVENKEHQPMLAEKKAQQSPLAKREREQPPLAERSVQQPPRAGKKVQQPPLAEKKSQQPLSVENKVQQPPLPQNDGQQPPLAGKQEEQQPLAERKVQQPSLAERKEQESPAAKMKLQQPPIAENRAQQSTPAERKVQEPPLAENKDQYAPGVKVLHLPLQEKRKQELLSGESKKRPSPPEQEEEQEPSPEENKQRQSRPEGKEWKPGEPMAIAETFVTVHGCRPPAPSSSASEGLDEGVPWMRPFVESPEAEFALAHSVAAIVAPKGAARRKSTGVAPRRLAPDSGSSQATKRGRWSRRGSPGLPRGPRASNVSPGSAISADFPADLLSLPPPTPQPLPFDCDACQTRFGDRLALAAHSREHGVTKAEPCQRCGRLLATPLDRARHERRHRAVAESRKTSQASAILSTLPTRLMPQRRGRNPTRCGACGGQFRAAALKEHFAPHPRTGYYLCETCGDAFAQQCQLELHVCSGKMAIPYPQERQATAAAVSSAYPMGYDQDYEHPAEYFDEDDYEDVEEDDGDVYMPSSGRLKRSSDRSEMRATKKARRHTSGGCRGEERSLSAGGDDDGAANEEVNDSDADGEVVNVDAGGDKHNNDDGTRYECTHCGRNFVSARNLARHVNAVHLKDKRGKLCCELCHRSYSRLDSLVRHSVEAHDQTRQFPCTRCHWKFTQKRILDYHMQNHEEGAEKTNRRGPGRKPRPYRCTTCKKSFNEQSQLDEHECLSDRPAEPACICDICGKTIKTKVWLSRHMLLHEEERPAKCETCGQGFIDEKALAKHAKTHTDGRRFLCDICGKGFALKITLQIHSRTHTGERPYACESCGKRFSTRTQLFHHAKIHSGEKPYVCTVCSRGFRQSHHLKTHMKIHEDRPEREAREARNARALEAPPVQLPLADILHKARYSGVLG